MRRITLRLELLSIAARALAWYVFFLLLCVFFREARAIARQHEEAGTLIDPVARLVARGHAVIDLLNATRRVRG